MSEQIDRKIVRSMAVPSYLVWAAITLITALSTGPIYQQLMLSDNLFALQRETSARDSQLQGKIADSDREIASMKVKQDEILSAIKSLTGELSTLNRSMAVISSKMP